MERLLQKVLPAQADDALASPQDAHDRAERRGLSGAIATEQSNRLALTNIEIDAMEDVAFTVPGVKSRTSRSGASLMLGSHIGLANARVVADRLVRPIGENFSASEDGDPVAQIGNHIQVVLDHQDRSIFARSDG